MEHDETIGCSDVVLVVGTSYSGSALLAFLINSHPLIVSVGEVGLLGLEEVGACSCGAPVRDCPFYGAVTAHLKQQGVSFDIEDPRLLYGLRGSPALDGLASRHLGSAHLDILRTRIAPHILRRSFSDYARRNKAFIDACLGVSGARIFFDTTPTPHRLGYLKQVRGLRVRVLHLVRRPQAVVDSMARHEHVAIQTAARAWRRGQHNIEAQLNEDALRIHYEDLTTDPQGTLNRIAAWIGVERVQLVDDHLSIEHHVVGHPTGLGSGSGTRSDDGWRDRLSEHQQHRISRRVGRAVRRYGYDLRSLS